MTFRIALLALLLPNCAHAIELDWVMFQDPVLPRPAVEVRFPPGLVELWLQALERPERDLQRRAAVAITVAKRKGLSGLEATIQPLMRILDQSDEDRIVRLATARALAELDARDAAPLLFSVLGERDADLAEIVEPALARWGHGPLRDRMLARLESGTALRRMQILAIRGLAELQETKSQTRLLEIAHDRQAPVDVRFEAAVALGRLQDRGLDSEATRLARDKSKQALVDRLVAVRLLTRHRGGQTESLLAELATDSEPVVQAVALQRLSEIDPQLIKPLVEELIDSPDATVRRWCAESLGAKPTTDEISVLTGLLDDPHQQLRRQVADRLLAIAADEALREAVVKNARDVLDAAGWRGQEQAILLLVSLADKSIASRLLELLAAQRAEVHVTAAWGLSKLAVEATAEPILEVFQKRTDYALAGDRRGDRIYLQVCHLAQALGQLEYEPADGVLREYVPKGRGLFTQPRAAAIWALGRLHAGNADERLTNQLRGRLTDIDSMIAEEPQVRTMAAIALGRMNATATVESLRAMLTNDGRRTTVGHACAWAIHQLTDEPIPELQPRLFWEEDWFLMPNKTSD